MHFLYRIYHFFTATPRKTSVGLGLIKLGRAILALLSVALSAKYFGASLDRDAWVLATTLVLILTQVIFGPLNEILRARYVHLCEKEGKETADRALSSLLGWVIGISFPVVLFGVFWPGVLSQLMAPGFSPEELEYVSLMVGWIIPTLVMSELVYVWTAVLNTYRSFFLPDLLGLLSVVVTLAGLISLAPVMGIFSLVVGLYFGQVMLMFILAVTLHRRSISLVVPSVPRWSHIRPFALYAWPFYVPYAFGQLQLTVERMLCTLIGVGSASVLDYARKFVDLPISVVTGVTATVLTPILASLYSQAHKEAFLEETMRFTRLVVIGLLPLTILFVVCADELVTVLLLRGAFTESHLSTTAGTLRFFGAGVLPIGFYVVAGQSLIAQERVLFYSAVSSTCLMIGVGLSLILFRDYGVPALSFSWTLAHLIASILLFLNLQKTRTLALLGQMARLMVIALITLFSGFLMRLWIIALVGRGTIENFLVIGGVAIGSSAVILGCMQMFKMDERKVIYRLLLLRFNPVNQGATGLIDRNG